MENQWVTKEIPTAFVANENRVERAARWLASHRAEIVGPVIPCLKDRFGLKNLEAIEATKRARHLQYGGEL